MKRILLFLFFISSLCIFTEANKQKNITINIWVHGTHPIKRLLELQSSPFRSWIYVPSGLSLAKDLPEHYHFRQIAETSHNYDGENFNKEHFYLYGWYSSNLRSRFRKTEGEKLFKQVELLLHEYSKQYENITIRFIGFSHGGNIILNFMNCLPFNQSNITTEIVLIGTPVEEVTREFVNCSFVKKVYSFYSDEDWIQTIDPQRFHHCNKRRPFFSKRLFHEDDQVIQVNFKVDGKGIGHGRFRRYLKYWPEILQLVDGQIETDQKKAHVHINYCTK